MADKFDVVILGTGNAGMGAAGVTRAAGKSVTMVESWDIGGTCPLRGCVPKKVLVAAAQVLHQIDLAPQHHISVGKATLDWPALIARERTFVDGVPDDFRKSLENREIELIEGRAKFVGENAIAVNGRTLEADNIVIATGSTQRMLPIKGAELMITSDDILELATLPDRLVFIGGGVIALEFGHVFARAGTEVTILEVMDRLLPRMEADAVAQIHKESERIGINILTGVTVDEIAAAGNALQVNFTHDGKQQGIEADRVANGAGRVPDVADLELDAGNVAHDGLSLSVTEELRSTSNSRVWVAGDAVGGTGQLSPVATYEGRIVGNNILNGGGQIPAYDHIPANVYTVPALASVGMTEEEATASGRSFQVKGGDMSSWRSSMTHAETVSYSKVLVEDGTNAILGAHIVGHGAEEIIHLFAMTMKHGLGAAALTDMVYAYPTFASDIKFMV
ncbi:MAG: NAD(P)/FAD-dependent oxidoreductase [Alphaproteobacteria bacterium]|nr:NAD(P)/FAD-dependent oxidoreductase [Alphaproteobacteria bacterium]